MSPDAEKRRAVHVDWNLRIPLADDLCLSATLYRPQDVTSQLPTILTMTPYIAQTYHERGTVFSRYGFVFLAVDVRGRGASDGVFDPYRFDREDVARVIDWIVAQPFSDGQVMMWGGSYGGLVQWLAAADRPTALRTIVPAAAPLRGLDSPARNNIFSPERIQWLTLLAGRTSQALPHGDQRFWNEAFRRFAATGLPFRRVDSYLGLASPIFQQWLDHPEPDDYWEGFAPSAADYRAIDIPILTITGAYDGDQPGAIAHYRHHLAGETPAARGHYLVIGPWDHAGTRSPSLEFGGLRVGPNSLVDLNRLHVDWYGWALGQTDKPNFLSDHVVYYMIGADEWRGAPTLKSLEAERITLFLDPRAQACTVFKSGDLTLDPPANAQSISFTDDPLDDELAEIEVELHPETLVDQSLTLAAGDRCLIFHSAPLRHPIEIAGFPTLFLCLAIDQPDADLFAALYEIGPDGGALLLARDIQRARYRRGLRAPQPLDTPDPEQFLFDGFNFIAKRLPRRSRLRLVVGALHSIFYQRNCNAGGPVADETADEARTVTVTLLAGGGHPSRLCLPVTDHLPKDARRALELS